MTLRRKKTNIRKSRKMRPFFFGGNNTYAKVFLIDVNFKSKSSSSSEKTKTCYPKDKKENNHNDPCYEPEWVYSPAGKKTNKVLCLTEKQMNEKDKKKINGFLDALQNTVEAITKKGGKAGDLVENVAESGY
jgi:hypothetical protein